MIPTPEHLDECRRKIREHGYKATARESGVPETTVRRFAAGRDILHRSTMKLLAWAFPVGMPQSRPRMRYVVGFMFDSAHRRVVLIRKNKPAWQKGLTNGVGGKIEPGETPVQAMVREYAEETGVQSPPDAWFQFCVMEGDGFEVVAFHGCGDGLFLPAETKESEPVLKPYVSELALEKHPGVSNLLWLIFMALDDNDERRFQAVVTYPKESQS